MKSLNNYPKVTASNEFLDLESTLKHFSAEFFFYKYSINGEVSFVSDSVFNVLGYSPEEYKTYFSKLLTANPLNNQSESKIKQGLQGIIQDSYNLEIFSKSGNFCWLALYESPIYDENNSIIGLEGIAHNITKEKQNEIELSHIALNLQTYSKMATLGEATTNIAHEINQPLTYIDMVLQLIEFQLLNKTEIKNYDLLFERIKLGRHQIERISSIITHLRMYGRKDDLLNIEVNIADIINNCMMLFSERIRLSNTPVNIEYSSELPKIKINPNKIEQVLINLFQNALDACESKKEKGSIFIYIFKESNYLRIVFQDTGIGIPKEILNRIYEPFFTTKEVGKGTGLGLSIVNDIIREHFGFITCQSEENKGTTFTIDLPFK